jgi:hypothetical protein
MALAWDSLVTTYGCMHMANTYNVIDKARFYNDLDTVQALQGRGAHSSRRLKPHLIWIGSVNCASYQRPASICNDDLSIDE